jgi:hypothetical protein
MNAPCTRRQFLQQVAGTGLAAGFALRGAGAEVAAEAPKAPDFTLTRIAGKPRERGKQYGQKFQESIRAFLDKEIYRRYTPNAKYPKDKLLVYAGQCATAIKEFSPTIMDEMEGMAEGSGLKLEELVLITLHEELVHGGVLPKVEHCTPLAAGAPDTADGNSYVGQTWDWMASVFGLSSVLHWQRTEGPGVLAYAYPGLWVCAGVNAAGVGMCWVTGPGYGPNLRVGIPAYVLCAQVLYQDSLDKAVAEVRRDKHAGTFTFLVADASGQQATLRCGPGKIDVAMAKGCSDPTGRAAKHMAEGKGKLDVPLLQTSLKRVCIGKKSDSVFTVDGMLFNTTRREAHFTRGPDLAGAWQTFRLDDK